MLWYHKPPAVGVSLVEVTVCFPSLLQKIVRRLTQEFNHESQLEIEHSITIRYATGMPLMSSSLNTIAKTLVLANVQCNV